MNAIDRRSFLKASAAAAMAASLSGGAVPESADPELGGRGSVPWYTRSRRRCFLDFHIAEWDAQFLSKIDPASYAECVKTAKATATTVFANAHTGLCTYPTKVGKMHACLKGRDLLKEFIEQLHGRSIDVVVYYCSFYTDWYYDNHPEARVVDAQGRAQKLQVNSQGKPRRFSMCCMNNRAYREFAIAQLTEICKGYDFEGLWPDMTFWPTVCYCETCRKRYHDEVGAEIPRQINWEDPAWVKFQRTRQRWLLEYTHLVTATIKKLKPGVTVAHQSQTFTGDWLFGASLDLCDNMDWLSSDLYGERYGLSFYGKLFHSLSRIRPFEHINCWNWPHIHEHVVTRTESELRISAFSAFAHDGAMVFLDALDPVGTVHKRHYAALGKVFGELADYESFMGDGKLAADAAIYFSFDSDIDLSENGQDVMTAGYNFEPGRRALAANTHRKASQSLAKTLIQDHIPYAVVTRRDLGRLADYQVVLLPNVAMLDKEEMDAFRTYVRAGGGLYASKGTSLLSTAGVRQKDFPLGDLLGVAYAGETHGHITYVTPEIAHTALFRGFDADYPFVIYDSQLRVQARKGAETLATITLPYTDPGGARFSSILTDPPGIRSADPAVVLNRFGKGRVLYAAGVPEMMAHETQRQVIAAWVRFLCGRPLLVQTEAPKSVEILLWHQPRQKRCLVNLLNHQQELPNIPILDLKMVVRTPQGAPKAARLLPARSALACRAEADSVEFRLPRLDTFAMVEVIYE